MTEPSALQDWLESYAYSLRSRPVAEASVSARRTPAQCKTIQQRAPSTTYTALDHGTCAAVNQYDRMDNGRVQRQTSDDYLKPEDQYDYISTPEDADTGFKVVFHKY